jgi:hypothetical protein
MGIMYHFTFPYPSPHADVVEKLDEYSETLIFKLFLEHN